MVDYKHFVAGTSGGVVSSFLLHPLDLIKIRFSVGDGLNTRPKYTSMFELCRSVVQTNGVRGLYAGVLPNVTGAGLSWGCYFFFYNTVKSYLNGGDETKPLSTLEYLGCGCLSGSTTLLMTNPIWVAKTRMCLQYENQGKSYRGLVHTVSDLYKTNGIRGLYKGLVPGLFGTSHGAIQFLVYERIKIWNNKRNNHKPGEKLRPLDIIAMSATSKVIAAGSTYPYQVVRSRLQDQHRSYNGVADVVRTTYKNESWRGFYKGLGANLLRVVPACCITFFTYERVMFYL